MAKICVFCGKQPESKNKEHVIPKWLIKMTGDPNRQINLGLDIGHFQKTGEIKNRVWSFNAFTLPACEHCNSESAKMENEVMILINNFRTQSYFSAIEIDLLFDWFDKIRVGLWLESIILDKIDDVVAPNFHITKRMGTRDRCLFIYECMDDQQKGIQFVGTTSPGFQFQPSCFTLRINNFYFLNISSEFLLAKRIGFPYPKSFPMSPNADRGHLMELTAGDLRLKLPLLPFKLLKPGMALFQPIVPPEVSPNEFEELYNKPSYTNQRLLNKRKGSIFYEDGYSIRLLDERDEIRLDGYQQLNLNHYRPIIGRQTLLTIDQLLKREPDVSLLNEQSQKNIRESRDKVINSHNNFMRAAGKI
jgi:hypothetical protein